MRITNTSFVASIGVAIASATTANAALVGHWEFNETPGAVTTTADSSGNGHTGTASGSGQIVFDATLGSNVYQNPASSLLDVDSTVAIPNLAANGGLTLALWVRRDVHSATKGGQFVGAFSLGTTGNNPIASIGVTNNGSVIGYIEGDGGSDQVAMESADGLVLDEVWTHLAMTVDRSNNIGRLYINGAQTGTDFDISVVGDGELNWAAAQIGGDIAQGVDPARDFQGRVDDVRYYDEVLSASAVAALVPEPGSLAMLGLGGLLIARRRRD